MYLEPTEHNQTDNKIHHYCTKYKKRVKHLYHHPNIVSLDECKVAICQCGHSIDEHYIGCFATFSSYGIEQLCWCELSKAEINEDGPKHKATQ